MRTIPQRELRNDIARVLREVEGGERFCITVDGRPVANLLPIGGARRTFVPRDDLVALIEQTPLDAGFNHDVAMAGGATIDEL